MKTLVIAPHPDDELLGCGGTLLRRKSEGVTLGWVIITKISEDYRWSKESVRERENEIEQVRERLGIRPEHLFQLDSPTTRLDTIPMGDLIAKVSETFQIFKPEEVLLPHQGDVHSDHRITFEPVTACTKWFRYPFVKRLFSLRDSFRNRVQPRSIPNIYSECFYGNISIFRTETGTVAFFPHRNG